MAIDPESWEGQELRDWVQNVEPLYDQHEAIRTSDASWVTRRELLRRLYTDAADGYARENRVSRVNFRPTLINNLATADLRSWEREVAV